MSGCSVWLDPHGARRAVARHVAGHACEAAHAATA